MEGHHSSIRDHQHTWQHRHQRVLYVGPGAGLASSGPPAAHLHGPKHYIWGITSRLLPGANLFKEPGCPPRCDPHQGSHWYDGSSQPGESTCDPWKDWILGELNLQGLGEWPKEVQDWAKKLLVKWEHLFACNDLDLGETSLIKHCIELTNQMPFKECYQ